MSTDEPKPFAEVRRREDYGELLIDGRIAANDFDEPRIRQLEGVADKINAAVEARETTLRGHLNDALAAFGILKNSRSGVSRGEQLLIEERFFRLSEFWEHEYVRGDVACALAFDVGMARGALEHYRPLIDALLEQGGEASELALRLAQALGFELQQPNEWARAYAFFKLSDDELRAECRRRGWRPETGLAPRFVARIASVEDPTRLPDLPSELRPGQVFGAQLPPPDGPAPCQLCGRTDRGCGPTSVRFGAIPTFICGSVGSDPVIR